MVTSQQKEVLWVLYFESQKQANALQGLLSSVHVVTEEEVVGLRGISTVFKEAEEVVVLSMDISTYLKGGFKFKKDGLLNKDLSALNA